MTPLERHIQLVANFAARRATTSDLAGLMDMSVEPGQRALVYRNSGLFAHLEALRSNYPRLSKLVGADFFTGLGRAYIAANPTQARSLVGYGGTLPDFINAQLEQHQMPWLADFARLDRAWLVAHLARDDDPADAPTGLDEAALLSARMTPLSSLQLVTTDWQVGPLWLDVDAGNLPETNMTLAPGPASLVFWRPHGEVLARVLSPGSAELLCSLSAGETLAQACENTLDAEPGIDLPALIADLFQSGWIRSLQTQEETTT